MSRQQSIINENNVNVSEKTYHNGICVPVYRGYINPVSRNIINDCVNDKVNVDDKSVQNHKECKGYYYSLYTQVERLADTTDTSKDLAEYLSQFKR